MSDNNELSLNMNNEELVERLSEESDIDSINNIIQLFNVNIKKKDAIRTLKLSELQDIIADHMEDRFLHKKDEFSNRDLLDYFKTVQEAIDKNNLEKEEIKAPLSIRNNQVNININNDTSLDRESKERVIDAVKSILSKIENNEEPIETEGEIIE